MLGAMALITCPDCQRQVSDLAVACPQCGRPIAGDSRIINADVAGKAVTGLSAWLVAPWLIKGVVAVVAMLALFGWLYLSGR